MTYDNWKTTEPEYGTGFVCDNCRLIIDEMDSVFRDGECWCPECYEKRYGDEREDR